MRRLLLLLLAFGFPFSAPAQSTYRVAGTVVDSLTGQPLDHAEVTLAPVTDLENIQTFLTGSDGRFLFGNLAKGKYSLTTGRRGYTRQGLNQHEGFWTAVATGPRLDSEHIVFRLQPSAVVTGQLLDEWSDPIADAEVLLFQRSWSAGSHRMRFANRATTDDLGRYRFAHLFPGTYAVAVSARPWYAIGQFQYLVRPPVASPSEPQPPTGKEGIVERDDAQFNSSFQRVDRPVAPRGSVPNPALDVVYPVTFFPGAASLASASRLTVAPGATQVADFTLRPVPALHVQIRPPSIPPPSAASDEEGQNQRSASAEVAQFISEDYSSHIPVSPNIMPDGLMDVQGLPPGELIFTAVSLRGATFQNETLRVNLSSDSGVDLSSSGPAADLSGAIQFDIVRPSATAPPPSAPVPDEDPAEGFGEGLGLHLELHSATTGRTYSISIVPKGDFTFDGWSVPSGSYEVGFGDQANLQVASLEATGAKVSGRTIELASGQPVKLTVHAATASCTVSGNALKDGKPLAGALILLVPQDPDQNPSLFHRDQSDSDGSFALRGVFPGHYTLLALENGWDLEWSSPSVLFRYLPNGIPLTLKPNDSPTLNPKVQ